MNQPTEHTVSRVKYDVWTTKMELIKAEHATHHPNKHRHPSRGGESKGRLRSQAIARRGIAPDGMYHSSTRLDPCPPTAPGAELIGQAALFVNADLYVHGDAVKARGGREGRGEEVEEAGVESHVEGGWEKGPAWNTRHEGSNVQGWPPKHRKDAEDALFSCWAVGPTPLPPLPGPHFPSTL